MCPADRAPDPAVLRSPGGFTWFYVDLVDDSAMGRGATLIWSWGLPFLPGYAKAARTGRPEVPIDRPSVSLVVYEGGREAFYLLSEFPPDRSEWGSDGRSWCLGDSRFSWTDTPAAQPGAAPIRTLQANLDLALPTGGRAVGHLRLAGPLRRDASEGNGGVSCAHEWAPMIAASRGCLELQTPEGRLEVSGPGYHDRNSSGSPLQDLGIGNWWWGRLALPGRDLIFYRLVSASPGTPVRDLVVEVSADGRTRVCEDAGVATTGLRRSLWGLRRPDGVTFADPDGRPVRIDVDAVVDNGPFYQRYLLTGGCAGEEGRGLGEHLVPGRVDTDLLRPLVGMRVHRAGGDNSMWLPLFSGDRAGRLRRLLRRSGGSPG